VTLPARLPISTLPAGAQLWRVHSRTQGAVWFGPAPRRAPENRFDAPAGEFRVCYFGQSLEAAFVETMVRGRGRLMVALAELRTRAAAAIPPTRELRLARLRSDGLVQLSLSADVPHAVPYADCQRLSHALWAHPVEIDGIEYRSRWDDSLLCVALFDRAARALDTDQPSLPLDSPVLIRPVLRHCGIGVD